MPPFLADMKFIDIEKKEAGRFITRYDITYETVDKKTKVYEIISRDKNITSFDELHNRDVDAVVLIVFNEDKSKILMDKEFRLSVGEWVYNFPAGLIDPGEDAYMAAKRELKEETGLDLIEVEDLIGESYSAVGFSNEKNVCVVCIGAGEFAPSTSTVEEIEPGWYSREEIRELLKTSRFAARSQAFCYAWSHFG